MSEPDVTEQLRDGIVSGLFAPHSPLRIDALATQFGVSHMPVREALRRLEAEGLVTTEPNRGARAAEVTPDFVANILDLFTFVEAYVTRRAAERATSAQLSELQAIQARYEAAAERQDATASLWTNREFHGAIHAMAGHSDGSLILDRHWRLIGALWRTDGHQVQNFTHVIADHRQILAALIEHDSDGAAALAAAHATRAKQILLARMRENRASRAASVRVKGEGPESGVALRAAMLKAQLES
ncbi:hypothetical protein RD110_19835 [Rhodoferax koreense]|uniref:HTH gntR-type domain-containing protein n=1 Tax=Rhodoferax koreensis TaxID=1842727 RepID=A0A1P8JZK4_9BURK|nr:hypothetical protein RD110_19835 [Rhodoferax koreense]